MTLTLIPLYCACSSGETADSGQLTYYYTAEYPDDMTETIKRYNRWCTSHSTEDMKINLIEFENYETMSQRLNIEVMAGGGPDLFSNYQDLPFEKMIQNGAFYDLNELIENDTSEDKLDLSLYNQTILDAGVYDGKRYFIPAFFSVPVLVGEKGVFEAYDMPTEQGYRLTFDNMDEVFADYLQDPSEYRCITNEAQSSGITADNLILRLVNTQIDYENKTCSFDEDFKEKLELLTALRKQSEISLSEASGVSASDSGNAYLFPSILSHSNPIWMEWLTDLPEGVDFALKVKEPVLYSCFEKDETTYSAAIADALFVNAATKKEDKVSAFLKYLLGNHLQNLYTGTDEEYWAGGGGDYLPVLNSAFESCIRTAYNRIGAYGEDLGDKEELSPTTMALIDHIEHINSVDLYADLYRSNYDRNVAIPILQNYWDGKIDADKCADDLSSATRIYLLE
ncbi:MAG: carbohydrate ABC transporter substrate-binding protein [Ruminococcus sp.]|nr:carbohydrate ABC transporter substrate-binding protein [Ruminococcus sp.]